MTVLAARSAVTNVGDRRRALHAAREQLRRGGHLPIHVSVARGCAGPWGVRVTYPDGPVRFPCETRAAAGAIAWAFVALLPDVDYDLDALTEGADDE